VPRKPFWVYRAWIEEQMIITDIRTQIVNLNFRNAVIVSIDTDQGITGCAETVMKRKTLTVERSILDLKTYLVGKDPGEIENHWEKMYRDSFWVGGPLHSTAISAVDCALWDIFGKTVGLPVYKLLGGPTRQWVPTYCHCSAGDSPEAFARNVKACHDRGYRALKTTLPMFYGEGNRGAHETAVNGSGYSGTNGAIDAHWKETEYLNPSIFPKMREFFIAAREAGGPEMGIAVDCHGRLNPKAAIRLCRVLEDLDLLFLEEPVPPESVEALCMVQRETSIPIAAGERWATIYGARSFIEQHAVDLLQCDLVNCGGITGMKKIAALAEAHYIGMAPHNPNGPLATIMNLHYAASIPNFSILEVIGSEAENILTAELVKQPPQWVDGQLSVPMGPGFGVELNQAALDARPYSPREGHR
jgi:galactonate dehydratase